jgi:hypothetical protein
MSTARILLFAAAGAAVGTLLYRYLGTEKGKELLNTASDSLKDLASKATDYAKTSLGTTAQKANKVVETAKTY